LIEDSETHQAKSCIEYFFLQEDGSTFKALVPFHPYFYVGIQENALREVEGWLKRKFERMIHSIEPIQKVDLDLVNPVR
jgi:DNA polymerase epsilon subunit 1